MTTRLLVLILLFIGSQFLTAAAAQLVVDMLYGRPGEIFAEGLLQKHPGILGASLIAGHALLIAILWLLRWIPRRPADFPLPPARAVAAALLALAGTVTVVNILIEWIGIPDWNQATFRDIFTTPTGILAIALTSPLAEELVFRQAFAGSLLRAGYKALPAVLFSSLVFGLIHANPAQTAAATAIGCLLGWLFVRGGLVLALIAHIFNNLAGLVSFYLAGNETETTLTATLGTPAILGVLAIATTTAVFGLILLQKSTQTHNYNEKDARNRPAHADGNGRQGPTGTF